MVVDAASRADSPLHGIHFRRNLFSSCDGLSDTRDPALVSHCVRLDPDGDGTQ